MRTKLANIPSITFKHLHLFAQYILLHKLNEYVEVQLRISKEVDVPVLKYLNNLSEEDLLKFVTKSSKEYLQYLADNKAKELIQKNLEKWIDNELEIVEQNQLDVNDIILITYARKQSFMFFMPEYCKDMNQMLEVVKELDWFLQQNEKEATNIYVNFLKNRIDENTHFIQKINNTSPAGIYVFDLINFKGLYSNEKLESILGYSIQDLNEKGIGSFETFIHPDDIKIVKDNLNQFLNHPEKEINSYKYRVKKKNGDYKWIRHYESVFKRNEDGKVSQLIGVAIDIDNEKKIAEQLQVREQQLLEAQEIAQIGSFILDFESKTTEGTYQLYKILEVEPENVVNVFDKIHPEDVERVKEELERSYKTGFYECEYRYNGKEAEKVIWSKGIITYKQNQPYKMHGTVMDITDRHIILNELKRKEKLYKQAEALSHLGNWNWNMITGELDWSDELYKIYGLDPGKEKITYEKYLSLIHPDDIERVQNQIKLSSQTQKSWEYTHRLIRPDGTLHHVFATGEVLSDNNGEPYMMIGTAQDITERQNLVDQLQQSEKLYKQAQALAHIGNWSWNIKTDDVEWSDELYRIYEIPVGTKMSYDSVATYVHPDDKEEVLKDLKRSMTEGVPYNRIHRIITKTGKIKIIHRKAEVQFDNEGQPLKLIGTTQDVTEQQRIQHELKENQTFLRKLTDATPSIITSYNINSGKYSFVSEGIEKLLGYKVEDALEKGVSFFMAIIHPDDVVSLMDKNSKVLEEANKHPDRKDIIAEFTYRMKNSNGAYRWFHTYGTIFDRNKDGLVEHVLNISLDVTEQVEATMKIKEQEYFIQQVADASPTVLYIYDVNENGFTYANREFYYVLDYTPDEIVSLGSEAVSLLYHPDDLELLPERKLSTKKFEFEDSMMQYECRMKAKDGTWKWVLVREIIFKKSITDGKVLQILGAALDITKRKEMEQTMIQNSFKLQQSNSSLEEFAYVASHDLKEPLRKISTFGDRLLNIQMDKLTDDGKIYLKKIIDSSQRMQTMINDLLSISMISGDRSFQKTSLQTILDEVLQTLEFKIEQKNAVINHQQLPEADIVPSQFRQLFQNIISNSLKFVREDVQPVITITHSYLSPDEIIGYHVAKKDSYHKIQISDNGIGFEEEYAGKIFAIFQRLHGRSEYEGTGIGLAICKKIVEHHGGIIYATAKPGEGSEFTIILPA